MALLYAQEWEARSGISHHKGNEPTLLVGYGTLYLYHYSHSIYLTKR